MSIENEIKKLTEAVQGLTVAINGTHLASETTPSVPNTPAPAPAAPASAPAPAPAPAPAQGTMDHATAQQRIVATYNRLGSNEGILAIMAKYGSQTLAQVPVESLDAMVAEIEAL